MFFRPPLLKFGFFQKSQESSSEIIGKRIISKENELRSLENSFPETLKLLNEFVPSILLKDLTPLVINYWNPSEKIATLKNELQTLRKTLNQSIKDDVAIYNETKSMRLMP